MLNYLEKAFISLFSVNYRARHHTGIRTWLSTLDNQDQVNIKE